VDHASRVLEFDLWLDSVSREALLERSRRTLKALRPISDSAKLESRRSVLAAWFRILEEDRLPDFSGLEDPAALLQLCRRPGFCLGAADFYQLSRTLHALARMDRFLSTLEEDHPFRNLGESEEDLSSLARLWERSFSAEGEVLDEASPALARTRRNLAESRSRVRDTLGNLLQTRFPGQDLRPTLRSGRLVIPVLREHHSTLPGIVHDESGSGKTLFVEPLDTVELNNRVAGQLASEREEIARILEDMSERLRRLSDEIEAQTERFHRLEVPLAIARANGSEPRSWADREGDRVRLCRARHPLLGRYLETGKELVPLDLELPGDLRCLLLSGPNTGGKTVVLKTLGFMVFLNQIGAPLPADDGCLLPLFDSLLVDIGDEQSLQDSQSTFSAHLGHLITMSKEAGPSSLILVDEIGDGTDPEEGISLARACMEQWMEKGARVLASSHFAALKGFAEEVPGAGNAAMEFDPDRKCPLYVLVHGIPGSSRALATAERLGLDASILSRARELLGSESRKMDSLLMALEEERIQAREERQKAESHRRRFEKLESDYEGKMGGARKEEKRILAEARRRGESFLEQARREFEAAVQEIRESSAAKEQIREGRRKLARLEEELTEEESAPKDSLPVELHPGGKYLMSSTRQPVELLEILGEDKVRISLRGLPVLVSREELLQLPESAEEREESQRDSSWGLGLPGSSLDSFRLDLRGYEALEAREALDSFLDAAQLSGFSFIEILHGKGRGVLRQEVRQFLQSDHRVRDFRLADQNQGGSGVTRANLADEQNGPILENS
jgi:DNA mismatch repair protein MutS2